MSAVEEKILARLQGLSPYKQEKVLAFVEELIPVSEPSWLDQVSDIFSDISAEEWDMLPADGSANLDHYLYGAPKK